MVDGAYNPGKYVEVIVWQTQGELPQKIVTAKCDSNMINMLEIQAYGKSGNRHDLNPGCDEYLLKPHIILVRIKRSGNRMKVYEDFQNEHGRKKAQTLDFAVQTCWNSLHSETM